MTTVRTVILCGGKGTRAYPYTEQVPKPLLEVAGQPVLLHVMNIYAAAGYRSFVLAAGFKIDAIRAFADGLPEAWTVDVIDTGIESNTGERIAQCRDVAGETFFATYADGLADIDLNALLDFHRAHEGSATMTTVPLPSQYGTISYGEDGRVQSFKEKPVLEDHWINAGFFVFDDRAFDRWAGSDLEREVLPSLGDARELFAYRHRGFWRSMDTYKDALELTSLVVEGKGPWIRSETRASL
jgi:glucose-1-phosphate cytidylyltransferase